MAGLLTRALLGGESMASSTSFKLYRYQLLPIDRHTGDLYQRMSVAQLIERKNELFAKAMDFVGEYKHARRALLVHVDATNNDAFFLRLAPSRPLTRELPDFRVEEMENWPHVTAIILNRPDEQYIAVQERAAAFENTDTVIKVIKNATRLALERAGLRLHIESMFSENFFWELVEEHRDRITWVDFEFITPNMANISKTLSEALKDLSKDTNAVKSDLQLRSDPAAALDLSSSNETVKGLVNYTSQGGGDITIKVKGIRKRLHTATSSRVVSMSELEITAPPDQAADILRKILK